MGSTYKRNMTIYVNPLTFKSNYLFSAYNITPEPNQILLLKDLRNSMESMHTDVRL